MDENDFYLPLTVNVTGDIRHHYDERSSLPAHELVIRPLLKESIDAFVYRSTKDEFFLYGKMQVPIKLDEIDILIKDKGKFKFDRTKECISGNEYLWNATTWKRGSIVIIVEPSKIDFQAIFENCYRPGLSATPNAGNTLSATKKCKDEAKKNNIGICFPASNGLEWMQIYASLN
jgi:hypothetical protein